MSRDLSIGEILTFLDAVLSFTKFCPGCGKILKDTGERMPGTPFRKLRCDACDATFSEHGLDENDRLPEAGGMKTRRLA